MAYLLVGLGNPSPKYDLTPHNLGRAAVLRWAAGTGVVTGDAAEPNKLNVPGFSGQAFRAVVNDHDVVVAPDLGCFMNESGRPIATLLSFYKIPSSNLIVAHDELALPLGTIRLGKNLSAAGHNGVASIIETLGTQDFTRIRLGAEARADHRIPSEDYVTKPMTKEQQDVAEAMEERAEGAITDLLALGLERTMNQYHRSEA